MNSITTILQPKKWLLMGLLFVSITLANAQEQTTWTVLAEENGLTFYYQQVECIGHNLVHIKVENNTGNDVNANYTVRINDGTYEFQFPNFLVDLKSGSIETSTCEEPNPQYIIPLGPQMSIASISLSVDL